jgi:hypothetical protein
MPTSHWQRNSQLLLESIDAMLDTDAEPSRKDKR